jgi:hypothetical protein
VAPLEGALRVRGDSGRFVLETVDYGGFFGSVQLSRKPRSGKLSSAMCHSVRSTVLPHGVSAPSGISLTP